MAAEGHGPQEKGHKWPEILSCVNVFKVIGVSVRLTPVLCPPFECEEGGKYPVLSPRVVVKDFRGGGPYLPLSCLPAAAYQLHTGHPNISEAATEWIRSTRNFIRLR